MIARRLPVVAALGLVACPPEPAPLFDAPFDLLGPYAAGGSALWVDRSRGEVHVLRPDLDGESRHAVVAIGHEPEVATTDLAGERLLVVTHGTPGAPGVAAEEEALWVVDPASATAERHEVGSPFTAIERHPDGERVFLHFDERVLDRTELVYNPNEVATIHLGGPADDSSELRTVRSFGGVPTRAIFAPPLQISGETVGFVAVLATNWVTLIDLDHPERSEISIPLTLDRADSTVNPIEVAFSQPEPEIDPVVYVSASGTSDVFAWTLRASPEPTDGGHLFTVATNLYAVGSTPTDLEPVRTGDGDALLAATGGTTLWLVDTTTSEATAIALEAPAERILPVPAADGTPDELLLYGSGTNVVHFMAVEGLHDAVARDVSLVTVPFPVADVAPLPDGTSAAVFHTDAFRSLSVLRLTDRSVAPLTATAPLDRTVFSTDGSLGFVAAEFEAKLSVLRVADRHPEDLRLDDVPEGILLVPGPEILVVTHAADSGLVTLLDARNPTREGARVLEGFLLDGLLDRDGGRR